MRRATVTMNLHPDRLTSDGRTVAHALHDTGAYRSQFETRTSNGSLTAHPGGLRDTWEAKMFGGAYQQPRVSAGERPRYGRLDLARSGNGVCPRFGSCHLRLPCETLARASFCFGNSGEDPTDLGVLDALEAVLAGLLEDAARNVVAQGRSGVDVELLVARVLAANEAHGHPVAEQAMSRAVDDYVEVQLHGPLRLAQADVQAIVIDPSFAGTSVGALLLATARRYGLAAEWSRGCELALHDVPGTAPDIDPVRYAPMGGVLRARARRRAGRPGRRGPQPHRAPGRRDDRPSRRVGAGRARHLAGPGRRRARPRAAAGPLARPGRVRPACPGRRCAPPSCPLHRRDRG